MRRASGTTRSLKGDVVRERELLDSVRSGNRQAFATLYGIYHPRLYGYLQRLLRGPVSIEEIINDVLYVVWKDARKYRGDAAVSTWIFGIAYRKAMSALRADRRYQGRLERDVDPDTFAADGPRDRDLVQAALAELSFDHRQVVELTYFGGFSYMEIAEIAQCPVNTVKTRMFHARRRLKRLVPALAGDEKERRRDNA